MSTAQVLDRLRCLGVLVAAEGVTLTLDAPPGVLTPGLLGAVKRHKCAMLALLAADAPAVRARVAAMLARHPQPWRGVPFLTVTAVPRAAPGCRSCGDPPESFGPGLVVRCRPCALAAWLVLDDMTRGHAPTAVEKLHNFADDCDTGRRAPDRQRQRPGGAPGPAASGRGGVNHERGPTFPGPPPHTFYAPAMIGFLPSPDPGSECVGTRQTLEDLGIMVKSKELQR